MVALISRLLEYARAAISAPKLAIRQNHDFCEFYEA